MEDDDSLDADDIIDDEDYDDEDYEDTYLDAEGVLSSGTTVWSVGWVFATAVADIAEAHTRFWENVRVELAHRHNQSIDQSDFIGSVEAGIEKL